MLHEQLDPVPLARPRAPRVLHRGPVQGEREHAGVQDQRETRRVLRGALEKHVGSWSHPSCPSQLQVADWPFRGAVRRLWPTRFDGVHRVPPRRPEGRLEQGQGGEALRGHERGRRPRGRRRCRGSLSELLEAEQQPHRRPLPRVLQVDGDVPRAELREGFRDVRPLPLGQAVPRQPCGGPPGTVSGPRGAVHGRPGVAQGLGAEVRHRRRPPRGGRRGGRGQPQEVHLHGGAHGEDLQVLRAQQPGGGHPEQRHPGALRAQRRRRVPRGVRGRVGQHPRRRQQHRPRRGAGPRREVRGGHLPAPVQAVGEPLLVQPHHGPVGGDPVRDHRPEKDSRPRAHRGGRGGAPEAPRPQRRGRRGTVEALPDTRQVERQPLLGGRQPRGDAVV
mmetsp:Transcript_100245/g.283888  ORF Transcript_100245/g.283888 Transcript_100245/m.283888 type:complete len:389 (+) Transcript_100245:952-2118(+)